jgi:hypothetical protein
MRAINHAATGAIIGLIITNPVALPLAFMSHYALDALPHHGFKESPSSFKFFKAFLLIDTILCLALVIVISLRHPAYWWLAVVCAFIAASPDFMWIGDFKRQLENKPAIKMEGRRALTRWHSYIQWFQRPIGLVTEIVWMIASAIILAALLA